MATRIALFSALILFQAAAAAQPARPFERRTPNTVTAPAGTPGPRATLADLAWFEGEWAGPGLGGQCEEVWSGPAGGAMMGMFRLLKDGKPVFYEFLTLVEQDGSLALKLKHFNPDLTGWEEKADFVTFRLLELTPAEARFDGLTFRRLGDDRMQIFLALRDRAAGTVREETFLYERVR